MAEWFSMGGYGGFIWPAYGLTFFALGALIFWSWRGYFTAKRKMQVYDEEGET